MKINLLARTTSTSGSANTTYHDCIKRYTIPISEVNKVDSSFFSVGQNIVTAISDFSKVCKNLSNYINIPDRVTTHFLRFDDHSTTSTSDPYMTVNDLYDNALEGVWIQIYDITLHGCTAPVAATAAMTIYEYTGLTACIDEDISKTIDVYLSYDPFTRLITGISNSVPDSGSYYHVWAYIKITKPTCYVTPNSTYTKTFDITVKEGEPFYLWIGNLPTGTNQPAGLIVTNAVVEGNLPTPVVYPNKFNVGMEDSIVAFDFSIESAIKAQDVAEVYSRV